MPEGPEIASIKATLQPALEGQILGALWRSAFALRSPFNQKLYREELEGKRIESLKCKGKVLWLECGVDVVLAFRLGMSGRLSTVDDDETVQKHTHLRVKLKDRNRELRYVDPRRFGDVCVWTKDELAANALAKLGPDPFSWTAEEMQQVIDKMTSSARPIKAILLDQAVLCGVGNIYACEAMFEASINPQNLGSEIDKRRLSLLLESVTQVMRQGLQNGGTTFLSYVDGAGNRGANQNALKVFRREGEPCL